MSTFSTKFITWLWISALLTATIGVSGQQIYCYCMGKTSFSFFPSDIACAEKQDAQAKSCCLPAPKRESADCCQHQDKQSKGCTQKTTKVFQLKTEFTLQEGLGGKSAQLEFEQPAPLVPFLLLPSLPYGQKIAIQAFPQPPPISGRLICLYHGVFLC